MLFLHFYAPRFITEVRNPMLEMIRKSKSKASYPPSAETLAFSTREIEFSSPDGFLLKANLTLSTADTTRATIILLHGIRSCKEHYLELGQWLAQRGYNSVALDLRAHGSSQGQFCTFGIGEKDDVKALIDHLMEKEKIGAKFGVWGKSLGGSVALQAMALDSRISVGVIESTFSDFRTITHAYAKHFTGFDLPFLTDYLVTRAGQIADFDPDMACTREICPQVTAPVLVVHGDQDQRINIAYGQENFAAISSPDKQFMTVSGAGHLNVWDVGGDEYFNTVFKFLDQHCP